MDRGAVRGGRAGRAADRGEEARSRAPVVPGPARHPARQDHRGRRRRQGDAQRLLDDDHAARQGHLAQDRVPGVHRRRRLRHAGDGRRRRLPDDRRPDHVPRAALGAADRLGAVRHLFPERQAGAVLDAASLSASAQPARRRRLRLHRRPRSRIPCVQDRGPAARSRRRGLAERAARGERALVRLSVSHRDALRSVGADPGDDPPRRGGARPAAALGRDRTWAEPVRVHLPDADRARAGRHHDAVPQRGEADLPPAGLPRDASCAGRSFPT